MKIFMMILYEVILGIIIAFIWNVNVQELGAIRFLMGWIIFSFGLKISMLYIVFKHQKDKKFKGI